MKRLAGIGWLTLLLAGCQTAEKAVQPLPPNAPPLSYQELFDRAKQQVAAAQEFFYRDSWRDLEQAAVALDQTGDLLARVKPEDAPARQKEQLVKLATNFREAATSLGEASKRQNADETTQAFQRLHLAVRDLRPE